LDYEECNKALDYLKELYKNNPNLKPAEFHELPPMDDCDTIQFDHKTLREYDLDGLINLIFLCFK